MTNDVQFFICILATSISSSVKCSPLLPIFKLGCLSLSSRSSLHPGYQSFAVYIFSNFLPDVTCLFLSILGFFSTINFLFPPTLLYFI